jgi:hypothetical protein
MVMHFRPWTLSFDVSELEARLFPPSRGAAGPGHGGDDDAVDGNIDPPDDDGDCDDEDPDRDDGDDDDDGEETLWATPRGIRQISRAAAHKDVV